MLRLVILVVFANLLYIKNMALCCGKAIEEEINTKDKSIEDEVVLLLEKISNLRSDQQILQMIEQGSSDVLEAFKIYSERFPSITMKVNDMAEEILKYRKEQSKQAAKNSIKLLQINEQLVRLGTNKLQRLLLSQVIIVLLTISLLKEMKKEIIQGFFLVCVSTIANLVFNVFFFYKLWRIRTKMNYFQEMEAQGKLIYMNFGKLLQKSKKSLQIIIPKLNCASLTLMKGLKTSKLDINYAIPFEPNLLQSMQQNLQIRIQQEQSRTNNSLLRLSRQLSIFQIFMFFYFSSGSALLGYMVFIQEFSAPIDQIDKTKQLEWYFIIVLGVIAFILIFFFFTNVLRISRILLNLNFLQYQEILIKVSEEMNPCCCNDKCYMQQQKEIVNLSMSDRILEEEKYCLSKECLSHVCLNCTIKNNSLQKKTNGCCYFVSMFLFLVFCGTCVRYKQYLLDRIKIQMNKDKTRNAKNARNEHQNITSKEHQESTSKCLNNKHQLEEKQ